MSHQQSIVYPSQQLALLSNATYAQSMTTSQAKMAFDSPIQMDTFTESSDVFTCTKAGVYLIRFGVYTNSATVGAILCYINGTLRLRANPNQAFNMALTRYGLYRLAVGDTVEVRHVTAAGTVALSSLPAIDQLQILRIGA